LSQAKRKFQDVGDLDLDTASSEDEHLVARTDTQFSEESDFEDRSLMEIT